MPSTTQLKQAFQAFARTKQLKATRQRDAIVDIFFRAGGHVSVDELLEKVRRRHPHIGYATVYRTLKLLCEAQLADERRFGSFALYEKAASHHHDHLICTECGRIEEFECPDIELLQEQVAAKHQFRVSHHKHEIYGLCHSCTLKRS